MTRSQPDFFIVGAPKCGTTSLDRYLSEHPQVFMGEKESHHFSDDLLIQTEPLADRETYLALFAQRGDEKRAGESSVYYLQSRKAARNIHEFDPEAKIIMHFRNPIELLYSHHSQLLYEGIQEIEDFSDALDAIGDRRWEDDDIRARVRVPEALDYWGVVDFLPQIERYREVFPAESLHVILFDDLMSDPEGCASSTDVELTYVPSESGSFVVETTRAGSAPSERGTYVVSVVPEPGFGIALLGGGALLARLSRSRRASSPSGARSGAEIVE